MWKMRFYWKNIRLQKYVDERILIFGKKVHPWEAQVIQALLLKKEKKKVYFYTMMETIER